MLKINLSISEIHKINNIKALQCLSKNLVQLGLTPSEDRETYSWKYESLPLDNASREKLRLDIKNLINEYIYLISNIRYEISG